MTRKRKTPRPTSLPPPHLPAVPEPVFVQQPPLRTPVRPLFGWVIATTMIVAAFVYAPSLVTLLALVVIVFIGWLRLCQTHPLVGVFLIAFLRGLMRR
jgi:hypothetical protein